MTTINLKIPQLPMTLARNSYVDRAAVVQGGFCNNILRTIVPGYAAHQDQRITIFFLDYFKNFIRQEHPPLSRDRCLSMIRLSKEHLNYCLQGRASSDIPYEVSDLERYILAARIRLSDFSSKREELYFKELCQNHCNALYDKWTTHGHSQEAFWIAPDLVDLVMRSFLHKVMRHPDYTDKIAMQDNEPQVKIKGGFMPWAKVRSQFFKDEDNRIYTLDCKEQKVYWWYFQEGLVPWDKFNWHVPHPVKTLVKAPQYTRVEIVTTQAKKHDWTVLDRYLKGVRHAFLRVVFGKDFQALHPHSPYKMGQVYSFGFGFNGKHFSKFFPLTTLQGKMMSPDYSEFENEDLRVTPLDISTTQAINLMNKIIRRAYEPNRFHPINANCAAAVVDLLSKAEILELPIESHMLTMWYKFLVPKSIRRTIDTIRHFFESILPSFVNYLIAKITLICHSIIFGPCFVMIGACRVQLDPEDSYFYRWRELARPHFNNLIDIFNPNKLVVTEARMIDAWQKRQPQTYIEHRLQ